MRLPGKSRCSAVGLLAGLIVWAAAARAEQPPPEPELTPPPQGLFGRPLDAQPPAPVSPLFQDTEELLRLPADPPLGYTGPSGVLPREAQESSHFVPVEDRWRIVR